MARFDLTDFEWSVIQPLLPNKPRGVPRVDDRRVLNGIFWRLRTGAPWADIPERYGPHTTCVNRFNRWRRAGVWDRLLKAVSAGLRRRYSDDQLLQVYPANVQMIMPLPSAAPTKRRYRYPLHSVDPRPTTSWPMPTGRPSAGAPARRASSRPALRHGARGSHDGPPQRIRDNGQHRLQGSEVWLVGEHRTSGDKIPDLANLPTQD